MLYEMALLRDVFLVVMLIEKSLAVDFCYEDEYCSPYLWGNAFVHCQPSINSRQSPVDLDDTMTRNESLGALDLQGFDTIPARQWHLKNNGHSVVLEVDAGLFVSGGGLPGTYKTLQLHFHWGNSSMNGSEHTVKGRRYPMEMHIVSMKTTHQNLTTALNDSSGLAVLGFFIDVADVDNANFSAVSSLVPLVRYKGKTVPVAPFPLSSLLPIQNMSQYYRYHGSLTTPPCSEAVMWTVYEVPIYVSRKQIAVFTGVYSSEEGANETLLQNNFRYIHDTYTRGLFASKDATLISSVAMPLPHLILVLSVVPLLVAQLMQEL